VADQRARYRDALRHRDFRLLTSSFIVDQVGSWAYNVVLIVWVFDKTHSPGWISATTAAGWLPRALFSPYAGVLADRYERSKVMLTSALACFVSMTALALVVAKNGPVLVTLALSACTTILSTPYRPAAAAVIPDVVPESELVAANAIFGGLESLVVVLGPGVGGILLAAGPAAAGITLNSLSFLVSAMVVCRLMVRSHGDAGAAGESAFAQFSAGITALWHAPVALTLLAFCCLDSAVYGASTVILVPLSHHLGGTSDGYGYLLAANSLGGVLIAGLANRFGSASRLAPLIVAGMLMLALPYAVVAGVTSPAIGYPLMVVSGAGMVIVDVLAVTALQRDLPREVLSRAFGLLEAAVPLSLLIASPITAAILHSTNLTDTLLAIGFGFSAAAILGLPPVLRADSRTAAAVRLLRPRVDLLESLDLFTGASRAALETLARNAKELEMPDDMVVVREGDQADALWVLATGSVVVSARGEARRARQLRTMDAPSYFGEIGILRGIPRTATVRCAEPCTLLRIEAADFLDAAQGAAVSRSLLDQSSARLARSHPRLSTTSPVVAAAAATES
jgi:CRP-like cAMP-binding protein